MQLGSSREDELPSDLEQELRNQLTNLRERVSDYVQQQFLLHGDVSGEQLREQIFKSMNMAQIDRSYLNEVHSLVRKMAKKLANLHSRRNKNFSLLWIDSKADDIEQKDEYIFISGPESGFSDQERSIMVEKGVTPKSLGKNTLIKPNQRKFCGALSVIIFFGVLKLSIKSKYLWFISEDILEKLLTIDSGVKSYWINSGKICFWRSRFGSPTNGVLTSRLKIA